MTKMTNLVDLIGLDGYVLLSLERAFKFVNVINDSVWRIADRKALIIGDSAVGLNTDDHILFKRHG